MELLSDWPAFDFCRNGLPMSGKRLRVFILLKRAEVGIARKHLGHRSRNRGLTFRRCQFRLRRQDEIYVLRLWLRPGGRGRRWAGWR